MVNSILYGVTNPQLTTTITILMVFPKTNVFSRESEIYEIHFSQKFHWKEDMKMFLFNSKCFYQYFRVFDISLLQENDVST